MVLMRMVQAGPESEEYVYSDLSVAQVGRKILGLCLKIGGVII